jgi:hypothetical protein
MHALFFHFTLPFTYAANTNEWVQISNSRKSRSSMRDINDVLPWRYICNGTGKWNGLPSFTACHVIFFVHGNVDRHKKTAPEGAVFVS